MTDKKTTGDDGGRPAGGNNGKGTPFADWTDTHGEVIGFLIGAAFIIVLIANIIF